MTKSYDWIPATYFGVKEDIPLEAIQDSISYLLQIEEKAFSIYEKIKCAKIVKNNIVKLNIKFKEIKPLFHEIIYDNNLYEINKENLDYIITNIMKLDVFYKYMMANINQFYNNYYKISNHHICDDDIINDFIRNTDDINFKRMLIERESFYLKIFDSDIILDALKYSRLEMKWNKLKKFVGKGYDSNIIDYVIKNISIFKRSKIVIYSNEFNVKLLQSLLNINDLNYFIEYSNECDITYKYSLNDKMDSSVIEYVIKNKLVEVDSGNIKIISKTSISDELKIMFLCEVYDACHDVNEYYKMVHRYFSYSIFVKIGSITNADLIELISLCDLPASELSTKVYSKLFNKKRTYTYAIKQYNHIVKKNSQKFKVESRTRDKCTFKYIG